MRKSIFTISSLALLVAGCGGGSSGTIVTPEQGQTELLRQVGSTYLHHQLVMKKPPTRLADFGNVSAVAGNSIDAIRSGTVVVRYGATLTDTTEEGGQGSSDEVLAYEKQVPETGGLVLMLNRSTRKMTADEFKSAKLAGTASSTPEENKIAAKKK
jgi:hypothetical protein